MNTPNFEKIDWEEVKNRLERGQYSTDLKDTDKKLIREALVADIRHNLDFEHLENVFIVSKGNIVYNNKSKGKIKELKKLYLKTLYKIGISTCWDIERIDREYYIPTVVGEGYNKDNIMNAIQVTKHNTIAQLLKDMNIVDYSIPYGRSRTIAKNEDKEIIACAYSPEFGLGCFIAKMKTKYMAGKIEKAESRTLLVPIGLKNAKELIKQIEQSKIKTKEATEEHQKAIDKQIQIEEEKEIIGEL